MGFNATFLTQSDRILSRNADPNPARQQQVDLRAEVEQLLIEHNINHSQIVGGVSSTENRNRQDDAARAAQIEDRKIILRLTEIKGLLERQEQIHKAK